MARASVIFFFIIFAIIVMVSYTYSVGYTTGEIQTRIVQPILTTAERFAEQAIKIPEQEVLEEIDPEVAKKNAYYKAINEAHTGYAEGNFLVVLKRATDALDSAVSYQEKAIAHYWVGLAYFRQGNLTQAEMEETAAIRLDSKYAAPYVTLSAISMNRGDYVNGLVLAQKAQEIDPSYPWAYNNQGIALVQLGKKKEGIEMFQKAIQLAPDSYVFKDNLTRAQNVQ